MAKRWTDEQDVLLATTIINGLHSYISAKESCELVSLKIGRSYAACMMRWQLLRKSRKEETQRSPRIRKYAKSPIKVNADTTPPPSSTEDIQISKAEFDRELRFQFGEYKLVGME